MGAQTAYIIDDSKSARIMLSRMLTRSGMKVSQFESGEDFLEHIDGLSAPNVIFMDHMMPGKDGIETTKSLRQDDKFKSVPVFMYTSKDDADYLNTAKNCGASGVLHKPANPKELNMILKSSVAQNSEPKVDQQDTDRNKEHLLIETLKSLSHLKVQVSKLELEASMLKATMSKMEQKYTNNSSAEPKNHVDHVTQTALDAALKQIMKQYDEKLDQSVSRIESSPTHSQLSEAEKAELENLVIQKAAAISESKAQIIAKSHAEAVAAKVAAAQSDIVTRETLSQISSSLRTPKLLSLTCMIVAAVAIALHFI